MSWKEARCPEEGAGRNIRRSMERVTREMRAREAGKRVTRREVRQEGEQRVRCLGG